MKEAFIIFEILNTHISDFNPRVFRVCSTLNKAIQTINEYIRCSPEELVSREESFRELNSLVYSLDVAEFTHEAGTVKTRYIVRKFKVDDN